jgi:hypothetical protein
VGQQHIRKPARGGADIKACEAFGGKVEMRKGMMQLAATARNPWMFLSTDFKRGFLGNLITRFGNPFFTRENKPCHNQGLRLATAFDQPPVNQKLVCPTPRHISGRLLGHADAQC